MAVLHRGVALQTVEHGAGEQLLVDLDGIGGRRTPISHGQRLALHRIGGIKPCNSEALGNIPGRTIGVGHGDGQTGGVKCITLFKLRFVRATVFHFDALHLFQRHGLGAVLVGSHGAGGGLIALLGRLGGVSIGVTLQQLIGRSLGGRNLRLAVLEGERGILRSHGEGHGDPLCSILRQRNSNIGRISHGVVLVRHGHAAGFCGVTVTGHGIGIRCIGGGQRHGGGAGISAAVDFERGIRGSNGKEYRRGGGLPFQRGVVPALDHEAIPQQGDNITAAHLCIGLGHSGVGVVGISTRPHFICALQVVAVFNCSSIPSDNCGCIVSTSSDTSSIVAILNTRSAIYITSYPSHIYGSCSAARNGTCVITILYCASPHFSNDTAYMSLGCGDFCTVDTATNGCAIGLGCNAGNAFRARHCTIHFHILHHGAARQFAEQADIGRGSGDIQRHGVAVAVKGAGKVVLGIGRRDGDIRRQLIIAVGLHLGKFLRGADILHRACRSQHRCRTAAAGHLGRRRFRSRLLLLLRLLIPGRDGVLRVRRSYLFLLGLLLLIRGQRVGQHGGGQHADDHHDGQQPAYDSLPHISFSFM